MIDRTECLHNIYVLNGNSSHVPRPCVLRLPAAVAGFQWQRTSMAKDTI